MVGWLTALLFTLIAVSTLSVREHATFQAGDPEGDALVNSVSPEYQTLLDAYTTNYVSYATANRPSNKTAADAAKDRMDAVLRDMRSQIDKNQFYIQSYLDEYKNMNPELDGLHSKAQELKDEGPKLADKLVASTQDPTPSVDWGGLVIRSIILAVIVGAVLMINSFA